MPPRGLEPQYNGWVQNRVAFPILGVVGIEIMDLLDGMDEMDDIYGQEFYIIDREDLMQALEKCKVIGLECRKIL